MSVLWRFICNSLFKYTGNRYPATFQFKTFSSSHGSMKVTIVGAAGKVGQPLCLMLKQSPLIDELCIHDLMSTSGLALELNHIDTKCKVSAFTGKDNLQLALQNSKIITIVAAAPDVDKLSFDKMWEPNSQIIKEVISEVARACPKALLAIGTNPINSIVPMAMEILKKCGSYNPNGIFGITALDIVRANTFVAQVQGLEPECVLVPVIGGHSAETIIPVLSQAKPCSEFTSTEIENITASVRNSQENISKLKPGESAPLANAFATARFVISLVKALQGYPDIVESAFVSSKEHPFLKYLATPLLLGPNGIIKNLGLPKFSDFEQCMFDNAVPVLAHDIKRGRKNILYFVDIHSGRVLSYNYNTKKVNFITLKGAVTPVIPAKKNENILIVGVERSLIALEWDGEKELGSQRTLTTVSHQFPQSRFNDGKADKQGRVWIGTMGFENPQTRSLDVNQGILYKLTKDSLISPKVEVAPVNISNGLCWNKANNKMYYIDSPTRKVIEYEFDEDKGDISNPRVAIDITKFPYITGNPDGMTIDQDDNLWIALYYGGSVIKANPRNGQLLQVVPIPARDVTSVMWGGPNLDILFVTTSRFHLSDAERKMFPAAGSVFAVTNLKQKGVAPYYADLVNSVRRSNLIAEIILNTNELFAPSSASNEVVSYPPVDSNPQKKRTSTQPEELPFWRQMINTIRSIF